MVASGKRDDGNYAKEKGDKEDGNFYVDLKTYLQWYIRYVRITKTENNNNE